MDRIDAYNQLPEDLKPLYEGTDERLSVLDEIFEELNLPKEQQKALVNALGDVILGVKSSDSFSDTLRTFLSPKQTITVTEKLSSVLAYITQQQRTANGGHTSAQDESDTDTTNRAERTAVEPMRTMETDMQKVHGYGALQQADESETDELETDEPTHKSEQTAVLQRQQVADTPTYAEPAALNQETEETTKESEPEESPADTRWSSNVSDSA